ncbi:hypothetical protein [Actinoplanes solisilvae]|uniref:hypothetical protein n=1 Tax=Actinoplanes solisilvae TaxID=2486853 RepID=UPI000FDA6701|nr:hypothetical protein [Actinoplanes solisilvae]
MRDSRFRSISKYRRPSVSALAFHVLAVLSLAAGSFAAALWVLMRLVGGSAPLTVRDRTDILKIALTIVAGIGGVVALVVAYRRQRLHEEENLRSREAARRDQIKLFIERFSSATAQLGNEHATVRIAGVYALASLADDWQEERRTCIAVLCAYFRMPYQHLSRKDGWRPGEREVRQAILSLICNRLRPHDGPTWEGQDFDLSGSARPFHDR